jgi:hypothetical protein
MLQSAVKTHTDTHKRSIISPFISSSKPSLPWLLIISDWVDHCQCSWVVQWLRHSSSVTVAGSSEGPRFKSRPEHTLRASSLLLSIYLDCNTALQAMTFWTGWSETLRPVLQVQFEPISMDTNIKMTTGHKGCPYCEVLLQFPFPVSLIADWWVPYSKKWNFQPWLRMIEHDMKPSRRNQKIF